MDVDALLEMKKDARSGHQESEQDAAPSRFSGEEVRLADVHGDLIVNLVVNHHTSHGRSRCVVEDDVEGYELRPDPLATRDAAEFVQAMRDYRVWAGEPSFRTMQRNCGGQVASSTFCKALKEYGLPPLWLVRNFIQACGGGEETVRTWVSAWRQLALTQEARPESQVARALSPLVFETI